MTNENIIIATALEHKIYTKEQIEKMIKEKGHISLHTLMGWKKLSPPNYEYRVKRGEKGIETRLWKKRNTKLDENDINETYYLTRAYLFTEKQVELKPIQKDI